MLQIVPYPVNSLHLLPRLNERKNVMADAVANIGDGYEKQTFQDFTYAPSNDDLIEKKF